MTKILITGALGFIGSAFVRLFHDKYDIHIVDAMTYAANLTNLDGLIPSLTICDIGDTVIMNELFYSFDPDIVVNFCAETHVDRSITDDSIFYKSNVLGVLNLLHMCRKYRTQRFLQVSCYDEKTNVFTKTGLKSYQEVGVGDEVLSLNPDTNGIEWKEVQEVIIQDYAGKMISFNSVLCDLVVTPNHRMYYQTLGTKKLKIAEAQKMRNLTAIHLPTGIWSGIEAEFMPVAELGDFNASDLMYLIGTYIGDGGADHQIKKSRIKTGLSKQDYVKSRDAKGHFISTVSDKVVYGEQHSYRIFLNVPAIKKGRKELENVLDRLGIQWTTHKKGNVIYFGGKGWFDFFSQFGLGFAQKKIPSLFLDYSTRLLTRLFSGLINTDGSYNHNTSPKCFFTSSLELKNNVVELMVKLGIQPRVSMRMTEAKMKCGRVIRPSCPNYRIAARYCHIGIGKGLNTEIDYKGKIWCLKVKGNRNMLVERNGIFAFCGNTDEVYGQLLPGDPAWTEESPVNPRNLYSASKTAAEHLVMAYHHTHGLDGVITRGANTYGAHQFPEKLLPVAFKRLSEGKPIPVYGQGLQMRDWLYVDDHARAVERVMLRGKPGNVYNIPGTQEMRNIDMVQHLIKAWGSDLETAVVFVNERPGHDFRYHMDGSKLKRLGWLHDTQFEQGIEKTVAWYREFLGTRAKKKIK